MTHWQDASETGREVSGERKEQKKKSEVILDITLSPNQFFLSFSMAAPTPFWDGRSCLGVAARGPTTGRACVRACAQAP